MPLRDPADSTRLPVPPTRACSWAWAPYAWLGGLALRLPGKASEDDWLGGGQQKGNSPGRPQRSPANSAVENPRAVSNAPETSADPGLGDRRSALGPL